MVKVTGKGAVGRRFNAIGASAVKKVGAAMFVGGQLIENDAAHSITEGSVSGKGHVPSRPGEPPNADTHLLDRNIETVQAAPLKVEVSSNAPYAAELELGTSKMEARPYMRPAMQRQKKDVIHGVGRAVSAALAESGRGTG